MALRLSHRGVARPIVLVPVLVVLALTFSSTLVTSSLAPGQGLAAAPGAVAPAAGSLGAEMLHAAQLSLQDHPGSGAFPRPTANSSNWTMIAAGPPAPPPTNSSSNSSANATPYPPARQLTSMAYDPVDGYVVMFGGGNVNPGTQFNDTWTFSHGNWTQLNISPAPSVRRSSSMVWDAKDGYILLFGGVNPRDYLDDSGQFQDTWSFLHGVWTNLTTTPINATNTPSARWNAQMAYDPGLGETILFGGCYQLACAASTNDTWAYAGGTWTNITASVGAAPAVRGTATLVWYPPDDALLMFGGANPNQTVRNDTWELRSTGWTPMAPANSPDSRGNYWMIYDNATGSIVLFGGSRYTVSPTMYALSDTWTYSNGTWTNQTLNNSIAPPPLWGFQSAGAYDPATGCGLLFGGADSNDDNYAQTWSYGCSTGGGGSSSSGGPAPGITISVTPSNGSAPLFFNATVQTMPPVSLPASNVLVLAAALPNSTVAWRNETANWTGASITVPGVLAATGSYDLTATLFALTPSGPIPLANASVGLVVVAPTSGGSGPWLSFSVSPAAGPAPLNVTAELEGGGGVAPYVFSVCEEGRSGTPGSEAGDAVCALLGGADGWNGAPNAIPVELAESGTYTLAATVTDSHGAMAFANVTVTATPAAIVAPLAAQAAFVAPSTSMASGASYGFVSSVSGGVAPYNIQWSFGDGSMGSAMPGSTVLHSYTSSGTYVATLTVTDARGTVVTSSVGPLVVSLPTGHSAAASPGSADAVVAFAAVVGTLSIAVIGVTVQQLVRRKEALNWAHDLEERLADEGSDRP